MKMHKTRIAVVHQEVRADSPLDEQDIISQVEVVCSTLRDLGYRPQAIPCNLDLSFIASRLEAWNTELVFNLVESLDGKCRLLPLFPAVLDNMGMPYTGSKTETLWTTTHKIWAKKYLQRSGILTPDWIGPYPQDLSSYLDQATRKNSTEELSWIIKSLWEHASYGLDDDGLITGVDEVFINRILKDRCSLLGGACFAEAFIAGREFNLSLIGGDGEPQVLAPAEIIFEGYEPDQLRIVGYRAKWDASSYEYHHTPRRFEFPDEDFSLLARLKEIALQCWHLLDLKGYARIDFRVDEENRPWVLEINANPCLSPDAGYAAALSESGISFNQALERIIEEALGEKNLK